MSSAPCLKSLEICGAHSVGPEVIASPVYVRLRSARECRFVQVLHFCLSQSPNEAVEKSRKTRASRPRTGHELSCCQMAPSLWPSLSARGHVPSDVGQKDFRFLTIVAHIASYYEYSSRGSVSTAQRHKSAEVNPPRAHRTLDLFVGPSMPLNGCGIDLSGSAFALFK